MRSRCSKAEGKIIRRFINVNFFLYTLSKKNVVWFVIVCAAATAIYARNGYHIAVPKKVVYSSKFFHFSRLVTIDNDSV